MNIKDEEILYAPKRRISNKLSWKIHHLSGAFYSNKMNKTIEYESLGEFLFYYLLELDKKILRYYVQPVEIPIRIEDKKGKESIWIHVPDVLVFRVNTRPMLIQIKESPIASGDKLYKIHTYFCNVYSEEHNWTYRVVFPKLLPEAILYNVKFISGFLKERNYYDIWIPEIKFRLENMDKQITIETLAESFQTKVNKFMILPIIYYLIAIGDIKMNVFNKISVSSVIEAGSISDQISSYISG